jgi:hypothetical protein
MVFSATISKVLKLSIPWHKGQAVSDDQKYRLDRSVIVKSTLGEEDGWVAYWLTKTLDERLEAIEYQRKMLYGYETCPRLQRSAGITRRALC